MRRSKRRGRCNHRRARRRPSRAGSPPRQCRMARPRPGMCRREGVSSMPPLGGEPVGDCDEVDPLAVELRGGLLMDHTVRL